MATVPALTGSRYRVDVVRTMIGSWLLLREGAERTQVLHDACSRKRGLHGYNPSTHRHAAITSFTAWTLPRR